jgi:hypothetical protein
MIHWLLEISDGIDDWWHLLIEPKILVLVLAIDKNPWKRIEIEGQIATWRGSSQKNVKILRYVGANPKYSVWKLLDKLWKVNQKIHGLSRGRISIFSLNAVLKRRQIIKAKVNLSSNEILTTVPDLYSLIGAKTLDAFDASILEFEFDYIFRTNVSSYLDIKELQRYVTGKPNSSYYAGVIGNHQGINFASGCGYFISRDVVIKVLKNRDLWDHNLIDDVSLGKLLTEELNINIQEVKRIDLISADLDLDQIRDNPLSVFHYRCKAPNPDTTIEIMKTLHKLV